jgi:hypothetical protein
VTLRSIDQYAEAIIRPRPEICGSGQAPAPGGEGGNVSSRLATLIGPNGLLATALLLSAIFVGLATAALN